MSTPDKVRVGPIVATVRRDRGQDAEGRWVWRARRMVNGRRVVVWSGRAQRHEVERELARMVAAGETGVPDPAAPAVETAELTTMYELLDAWIGWEAQRASAGRISENSFRARKGSAKRAAEIVGAVKIADVNDLTLEQLDMGLIAAGTAGSTRKIDVRHTKQAWIWAGKVGLAPRKKLESPVVDDSDADRHRPTVEEVQQVVLFLRRNSPEWTSLAVRLLASTGARVGAVARLAVQDVTIEGDVGWVRFRAENVKTRKARSVPMDVGLAQELLSLAEGRIGAARLWPVTRITFENTLRQTYLPKACAALGIAPFTPHGLRRLMVDRAVRARMDISVAAEMLGHSPRVMLSKYRAVTREDLVGELRRVSMHPRRGATAPHPGDSYALEEAEVSDSLCKRVSPVGRSV